MKKTDNVIKFKKGDTVTVSTNGRGNRREYTGKVFKRVAPGQDPSKGIPKKFQYEFRGTNFRAKDTYLVAINEGGKERLLWPHLSQMRAA